MNNELFSRLKDLAQKENRTRLAVLLGAAAMLLILLSELFTPSEKTAAASAAPADDNVYRQQLEQQLSDLIAQVEGAGRTTVMITLESGEETMVGDGVRGVRNTAVCTLAEGDEDKAGPWAGAQGGLCLACGW